MEMGNDLKARFEMAYIVSKNSGSTNLAPQSLLANLTEDKRLAPKFEITRFEILKKKNDWFDKMKKAGLEDVIENHNLDGVICDYYVPSQ